MNLLNTDNPFMKALTVLANLIILNWLFVLCALPFVTLGASLTAMHAVCMKIIRGEENSIAGDFFKAFKANFLQSTGIWLILLAAGAVLASDFLLASAMPGLLSVIVPAAAVLLALLWAFVWIYAFPLQALYVGKVRQTVKNAVLIGIRSLPQSLILTAVLLAVPYICVRFPQTAGGVLILSLFVLFSAVCWLSDLLVNRIFARVLPEPDEDGQA